MQDVYSVLTVAMHILAYDGFLMTLPVLNDYYKVFNMTVIKTNLIRK